MKKIICTIPMYFAIALRAQLYFPPLQGDNWETTNPIELGWCQHKIDSLYDFLNLQGTKAFIVLKDGKLVLEQYFNGHDQNSIWYWASAGKTITSFLVGIAQQEGLLDIQNPSSDYLGGGWTSCTPAQEQDIKVWHQLTMTTGLDDGVSDLNCTLPSCLQFLAPAGSRWSYHNAPYTLLGAVISNASGTTLNQYATQKLKNPTGMTGAFIPVESNMVYYSTARSMARFGLLILNNGNWNGNQIMTDQNYFTQMLNTSQQMNKAYGYLWWLNGKESFMVPGQQFVIPGSLMPNAPGDMISGLGKNGQFLNVVPSQNLVLVRMGEEPSGSLVPFLMNDKIWEYLNALTCNELDLSTQNAQEIRLFPNPTDGLLNIQGLPVNAKIEVRDVSGRCIKRIQTSADNSSLQMSDVESGCYLIDILDRNEQLLTTKRVVLK
jgi:CubicO group peptidase (beta-lactamase class C family)